MGRVKGIGSKARDNWQDYGHMPVTPQLGSSSSRKHFHHIKLCLPENNDSLFTISTIIQNNTKWNHNMEIFLRYQSSWVKQQNFVLLQCLRSKHSPPRRQEDEQMPFQSSISSGWWELKCMKRVKAESSVWFCGQGWVSVLSKEPSDFLP